MWLPVGNLVIGACRSAAFVFQKGYFFIQYSFVVEKQHLSDGI